MNIVTRLEELLLSSRGVDSIVVSDKDGVEIVSVPSGALSDEEARHNSQIVSTIFTLTHEQCEKLPEFKRTNFILSEYGKGKLLLQANYNPIVITIRADREQISDGALLSMVDHVKDTLSCIVDQVAAVA
jgi:hypothetical protein